jgi:hypothetical protein
MLTVILILWLLGNGRIERNDKQFTGRFWISAQSQPQSPPVEFWIDLIQAGHSLSGTAFWDGIECPVSGYASVGDTQRIDLQFQVYPAPGARPILIKLKGKSQDSSHYIFVFSGLFWENQSAGNFTAKRVGHFEEGEDDPCEEGGDDCEPLIFTPWSSLTDMPIANYYSDELNDLDIHFRFDYIDLFD